MYTSLYSSRALLLPGHTYTTHTTKTTTEYCPLYQRQLRITIDDDRRWGWGDVGGGALGCSVTCGVGLVWSKVFMGRIIEGLRSHYLVPEKNTPLFTICCACRRAFWLLLSEAKSGEMICWFAEAVNLPVLFMKILRLSDFSMPN